MNRHPKKIRQNFVENVVWIDVETNKASMVESQILEIYFEYAHWHKDDIAPVSSFYSLVVPDEAAALFAASKKPTFEEFERSLDLSPWCTGVFRQNGLTKDLYEACEGGVPPTAKQIQSELLDALSRMGDRLVFAGKNIHYDISVLARHFPLVFSELVMTKHIYDIAGLCMLCINTVGSMPVFPAPGEHRARVDVNTTRRTNRWLVDNVGKFKTNFSKH